ncbi:SIR2 family protein [Streptomyces hesseae]|uniref:SIR2 family protein n=1 Tax=Streptomyces hesseae TaxID=3075519 RepID=A0ABU2SXT6_9ACTN|nr:SIR2 family protein [Streptomyces sp. DSM 40473]MDT0453406.1 SIR2 family protein [Streptomyces sp. DSM 40473]
MGPIDFGDITDLKIRLQVLAEEADRRLVTVFGSGISSEVLPGVPQLTDIFRDHVPKAGLARFDATVADAPDPGVRYQSAAAVLTRQAGEHTVMRAIRTAVLQACPDVPEKDVAEVARDEERCREHARTGNWLIPRGYQRFAQFFASLSGRVRGPIITTNFDPLIEIALGQAGVPAVPIPIPTDTTPTMQQLQEVNAQPVLHIHGYWTGLATSNVPTRITSDRPGLDDLLRRLLTNSVVLVVGYSGWLDGFMRGLRSQVLNNKADLLEAEVLWAAYETDAAAVTSGVIGDFVEAPGFSLYLGVDGHELFTDKLERHEAETEETSSPYGYSRVPRILADSASYQPGAFAEGSQPVWADAAPGCWPVLSSTVSLEQKVVECLRVGGGGGAVAIGPLGEGKSLALRQVAHAVAGSRPEWNALWREPGAPVLTKEWLNDVRAAGKTLICVDEADLIMDDMVSTKDVWAAEGSGIAFLLASHDRLWWQGAGSTLRPWIDDVLFHGITDGDARNIALTWQELGLLPGGSPEVETVAERLTTSAGVMAAESNTLFGAVLDVRYGADLGARVEDLVRKLHEIKLTDSVDLGDVFGGICVMQHALDKDGNRGKGASRSVIAAMAGLDPAFADGKILQTLGREAAVTFAGNRVYCRHPSIAATVVDYLHQEGTAEKVYELVGQAGGMRLVRKAATLEGYRDAYLLSRSLSAPESVWAARGAVKGTGQQVLESRVSLLRALRLEREQRTGAFARGLAPRLKTYDDYHGAVRAFLVEFSISLRDEGEPQTSAGLAALALDDGVGYSLVEDRAGYALVSLAKSAAALYAQTGDVATKEAPALCAILLERVRGKENASKYLSRYRPPAHHELRQLSTGKLCGRLATTFDKAAAQAIRATKVDLETHGVLSFDTLRRLADHSRWSASW